MSSVLFSTTITSKIEEKEKVKNDIVKRQKQTISIHFRTMCRSVGRSSDFFPLPTHSLSGSLLYALSIQKRTEEKKNRQKRSDRKGRRRRFQCIYVRTSKRKEQKKRKRVGRKTRTTTDDGNQPKKKKKKIKRPKRIKKKRKDERREYDDYQKKQKNIIERKKGRTSTSIHQSVSNCIHLS